MRNRAFPSLHCDLRSSAEGFVVLDVISVQTRRATDGRAYRLYKFFLTQKRYRGKGKHTAFD